MQIKEWLLAVGYSFNPMQYKKVADAPPKEMFKLLNRTLMYSFLLMLVLALPSLFMFPGKVSSALGKFDTLNLGGDIETSDAIGIPSYNPQLVIDMSEGKAYEGERMLLTKKYLYFQTPLKPQKISLEYIKDPLAHKRQAGLIIFGLFMLWLPSLLIYGYIATFLKYLAWLIVASILCIILIRAIILSKMRLRKIINLCSYALVPIILIEVLTIPFDTGWLFPILDFMGFAINAVSLIVYLGLLIVGFIGLEKEIRFEVADRPRYQRY